VLGGTIIGRHIAPPGQEFIRFLNTIEAQAPAN